MASRRTGSRRKSHRRPEAALLCFDHALGAPPLTPLARPAASSIEPLILLGGFLKLGVNPPAGLPKANGKEDSSEGQGDSEEAYLHGDRLAGDSKQSGIRARKQ